MPCIQQKSCAKSELIPWNSQLEIVSCVVTMMTSVSSPDGVSKVLGGDAHGGARHAEQGRGSVVEFEHPVVDINLIKLEPAGQIVHKMSHGEAGMLLSTQKSFTCSEGKYVIEFPLTRQSCSAELQ